MKLISQFRSFLNDTVNLNRTRLNALETNVSALTNFVRQCDWAPEIIRFYPQGSWAHDTIIKPLHGAEFDADLLVLVEPVDNWTAADYVKSLGQAFSDSATYGDKAKTWDYCVTITYVGDRQVDIAPCVVGRLIPDRYEVCNRGADLFERSEPMLFTEWLKEQNGYSGSNSFRKVTRLLKYLRDIKTTFTCPSVLLTTLLANQIYWTDKESDAFADVPTTLKTVMGRLDDWLQARPHKPVVSNPHLASEDLAASWTEAQYSNFRNFINKYRNWIDEAYDEEDRARSIAAWRRIFGDEFAKGESVLTKASADESKSLVSNLLASTAAHLDGLVDAVASFGVAILPRTFFSPPHMQAPPWPKADSFSQNVQVVAIWQSSKDAMSGRRLQQEESLSRSGGIWFDVTVNNGQSLPEGYRVQWRITNTGAMAMALGQGRGGFNPAMTGNRRWESLRYRGVHIAEAFIIRRSDDRLVGQSAPFLVIIE
ncbi:cyclic GMP-AMP synthase DncV-like nucleotidyltransferase [Sphingorhabdus sp.]|uniref:SMODS domain-containing nucleotidyltransferase n=1 Tax=Sphingorhabdus sp. TaxID=1902408 RepID=UPI002B557ECD|nr:nucleotidyltransferase [Sphingorhabdus sp.]HMT41596.1 nucleotidyltransferase [Sphingorhabdus sp.]